MSIPERHLPNYLNWLMQNTLPGQMLLQAWLISMSRMAGSDGSHTAFTTGRAVSRTGWTQFIACKHSGENRFAWRGWPALRYRARLTIPNRADNKSGSHSRLTSNCRDGSPPLNHPSGIRPETSRPPWLHCYQAITMKTETESLATFYYSCRESSRSAEVCPTCR